MRPTLIVDCSIVLAWCFADESTDQTRDVQQRMEAEAAVVPGHWFLEVVNVLAMAEKRSRISTNDSMEFVRQLLILDIQADWEFSSRAFDHVLPLSRNHALSSYDAAYLELALRRQLPLATLDDALRQAATSLGVQVLGKLQ
jgi:predicted nucleic acid-binding protein